MNPRTTGILFLIAAAIAAFIYFYEIEGQDARDQAEADAKRLFDGVDADAITEIDLTTSDAKLVHLVRDGDGWHLAQPLVFPADEFAVDAIAAALSGLSSERELGDPQAPSVYGFDRDGGALTFRVTRGDAHTEYTVRIGKSSPVGGNTYVSVVGDDTVHLVKSFSVNSFQKSLHDLRRKRIADFDTSAIDRIEVDLGEDRVVAERSDGAWALVEPRREAADQETVDGLLSTLSFLRAEHFIDQPTDAEFAGLTPPAFHARLVGRGSDPVVDLELSIGRRTERGKRLVRAGLPTLFQIPSEQMLELPQTLFEFRFRTLAEFDSWDAQRMEILFQDGETLAITATKTDGSWSSEPETIDPEKLRTLGMRLSNLRAVGILAESMGEGERAELDLAPPKVTYRVFGKADADAAEDGEETEVLLAEVFIGAFKGSDGIVAQSAGNTRIFEIDLELAAEIPVSLEALHNRFLADPELP